MRKGNIIVLVVAAVVFTALGFTVGQIVNASIVAPGSASDPLVSESYVQRFVGDQLATLQLQIDALSAEVIRLTGNDPLANPGNQDDNIPTPNDDPPPPPPPTTVTVRESTVNVRNSASENGDRIATVDGGTTLAFLGQQNDNQGRLWYRVRLTDGREGWIAGWLAYDPQ